jgi:hypothetical protein
MIILQNSLQHDNRESKRCELKAPYNVTNEILASRTAGYAQSVMFSRPDIEKYMSVSLTVL